MRKYATGIRLLIYTWGGCLFSFIHFFFFFFLFLNIFVGKSLWWKQVRSRLIRSCRKKKKNNKNWAKERQQEIFCVQNTSYKVRLYSEGQAKKKKYYILPHFFHPFFFFFLFFLLPTFICLFLWLEKKHKKKQRNQTKKKKRLLRYDVLGKWNLFIYSFHFHVICLPYLFYFCFFFFRSVELFTAIWFYVKQVIIR